MFRQMVLPANYEKPAARVPGLSGGGIYSLFTIASAVSQLRSTCALPESLPLLGFSRLLDNLCNPVE